MTKRSWLWLLAALPLALAGCSTELAGEPSPAPLAPPVATQTESPPSTDYGEWDVSGLDLPDEPAGSLNDRGNHVIEVGGGGSITDALTGQTIMDFTITDVGPLACDDPYDFYDPTNGQFYRVDMEIETYDDPEQMLPAISPGFGWEFIYADGTSVSANNSAPCGYESITLLPNRKYNFTARIDIPTETEGASLVWHWNSAYSPGYEIKLS